MEERERGNGRDLAGRTGLEPATSDVTGRCSNQLNYRPKPRVLLPKAYVFGKRPLRTLGGEGFEPPARAV